MVGVRGNLAEVSLLVRHNPASLRIGLPRFRGYVLVLK